MLWAGTALAGPAVVGIRLGIHPQKTRIVLDITGTPGYEISSSSTANRLVIDLAGVDWHLPSGVPGGRGLVVGGHVEPGPDGHSLLVFDLAAPAHVVSHDVLAASAGMPNRLFIDLARGAPAKPSLPPAAVEPSPPPPIVEAASDSAAAELAAELAAEAEDPAFIPPVKPVRLVEAVASEAAPAPPLSLVAMAVPPGMLPPAKPGLRENKRKPVVALDAGHGGRDPGAAGVNGTMEKTITLSMARELGHLLEASGRYKVVLTRTDDTLLALRERIDIARAAGADLFISLHADHNANKRLRGASIYTLSETASDNEAAALAARENKEDLITGVDLSHQSPVVTSILIDLAQRETKNLSARLASLLTDQMADQTLMLQHSHRFAGFAVLKAPDVPSVLIELGYLSNVDDEAELRSPRHRARLAKAILSAIDRYFEWRHSIGHS